MYTFTVKPQRDTTRRLSLILYIPPVTQLTFIHALTVVKAGLPKSRSPFLNDITAAVFRLDSLQNNYSVGYII